MIKAPFLPMTKVRGFLAHYRERSVFPTVRNPRPVAGMNFTPISDALRIASMFPCDTLRSVHNKVSSRSQAIILYMFSSPFSPFFNFLFAN